MDTIENTKQKVEERFSNDLIVDLINKLGGSASARAIYGDPVERDGITIVPVAKVRWGCGFGGGRDKKQESEGGGGGGGVIATPIGYIELKEGSSQFKPIRLTRPGGVLAVIGGTIVLSLLVIGKAWGCKSKKS